MSVNSEGEPSLVVIEQENIREAQVAIQETDAKINIWGEC